MRNVYVRKRGILIVTLVGQNDHGRTTTELRAPFRLTLKAKCYLMVYYLPESEISVCFVPRPAAYILEATFRPVHRMSPPNDLK